MERKWCNSGYLSYGRYMKPESVRMAVCHFFIFPLLHSFPIKRMYFYKERPLSWVYKAVL